MKKAVLGPMLLLLSLALVAGPASAQKVYRWVDRDGQVHYGDSIPPEYAGQDREEVNRQGVAVSHVQGTVNTDVARKQAEQDKAAEAQARHDHMLTATYQSVDEIEQLRQRRLDQLDAQITIQQQSLATLKSRRAELQQRASHFSPSSDKPNAPPMPDGMADDLARSESDIHTQEVNLEKRRQERVALNQQFDADVKRFKELRRIE